MVNDKIFSYIIGVLLLKQERELCPAMLDSNVKTSDALKALVSCTKLGAPMPSDM